RRTRIFLVSSLRRGFGRQDYRSHARWSIWLRKLQHQRLHADRQRYLPGRHADVQFLRGQVLIRLKGFSTLPAQRWQPLPSGRTASDRRIARGKRIEIARLNAVLRLYPRIWRRAPETPDRAGAGPMPD